MTAKWPVIKGSVTHHLTATHSLPSIGVAEKHGHVWIITAGWSHEINPGAGHTMTWQDADAELKGLVLQLQGKHLNDIFKQPPTAETIACWVGARLPAYWSFVKVASYGNFECELQLGSNRQELLKDYR